MIWTRALLSTGVLLAAATHTPALLAAPAADAGAAPPADAPADAPTDAAPADAPAEAAPAEATPAEAKPVAAEPEGPAAGGSVKVGTDGAKAKGKRKGRQVPDGVVLDEKTGKIKDTRKWIHRYKPERHLFELGIFGGLFFPKDNHDLFQVSMWDQDSLWKIGPEVGLRLAYFPLSFLGVEGEFGAMPMRVRNPRNDRAFVYRAGGHAILQLPYRVAPFILGGYGGLGIVSDYENALGRDIDEAGHFGGGVKIFINRMAAFRLEGRGIIGAAAHKLPPNFTTHAELLAGFSLVLGRTVPKPKPKDLDPDRDGFLDPNDKCPKLAGVAPDGCPAIDSDKDTFLDNVDKCPFEPGVAPDGCPPPDRDKDGFLDFDDKCPDEPGVAPDGCPLPPDTDCDGIIDKDDTCPFVPETYNGFEDRDGCPDKLPEKVVYDGRPIEGIYFETNSDKIQKKSQKTLDATVAVLKEFPSVRIEISGHTDDVGNDEFNLDLSRRRAESVKTYLVDKGVESSRVETVGYGRTKPIAEGKTAKARAKNRRIEFRVIVVDPRTGQVITPATGQAIVEKAAGGQPAVKQETKPCPTPSDSAPPAAGAAPEPTPAPK
ncbi:MAG: OmpA family protein [Myxococcales bacterium]|nr:OmpA family protein [Myxococcales bacterium]